MQRLLSQVCYMYGVPMIWSKMIGYDNLICNVVWCYGTCLQASLLSLLLKSFILFFYGHFAKCKTSRTKIAIVYVMTTLWHKSWCQDMHHYGMVCKQWEVWPLMCTSHVAGNTQRLVSMGKLRKSKAMGLSMQMQESMMISRYQDDSKWKWYQSDVAVRSSHWRRWAVVMLMSNRP